MQLYQSFMYNIPIIVGLILHIYNHDIMSINIDLFFLYFVLEFLTLPHKQRMLRQGVSTFFRSLTL